MIDYESQWYPYQKVHESYYDLLNTVCIPKQICDYLIDAPQGDYTPKDDNSYSRCRFWKYLYYDEAKPLDKTLPTIEEKMSVVFNPSFPENPPTQKGYRLIPEIFVKQAQDTAQTRVNVYMGRTVPSADEYKLTLSVVFMIWTHYTYELNTKTDEYSRAFALEQSIIEAFHGVNMAGIGTFFFSKSAHPDCGSRAVFDGETNVGREVTLALEIATTTSNRESNVDNLPSLVPDGTIKLA